MAPSATSSYAGGSLTTKLPNLMLTSTLPAHESMQTSLAESALLHRSFTEQPHMVLSASGHHLRLENGREILDACGGAAVVTIGHGNEEVRAAALAQLSKLTYVHSMTFTSNAAEELARCLLERMPGDFDHGLRKAYFVGSGSEANDAAMKCARQYWFDKGQTQRTIFVSRKQSYHGNTIGSMSISSNLARKEPYANLQLKGTAFVSPAYAYRDQRPFETEEQYASRLAQELDDEFQRLGPENVISFVAEPVSGATLGCVPAPKGYFQKVRAVCDKYGILLHLDEIMCGAGRTGTFFAFEQEGVRPDIVTMGKGLGSGYAPVSAMLLNERVVDGLRHGSGVFNHGHTFQAFPLLCSMALASLRILKRERLVSRCALQGLKLEDRLKSALLDCKYVGDVRGRGLFWGVEFVRNKDSKEPFGKDVEFARRVCDAALEMGVNIYYGTNTSGKQGGDHILLAPPFTIFDHELDKIVEVVKEAYKKQERRVDGLAAL